MANGPTTEAEAKQVEWAAVWQLLPEEMKAGLAKLEADHPGEVLSTISGGVIEAVPEGRELGSWMEELAGVGGFAPGDDTARRFAVTTYWVDPITPEPDKEFKVGFQVSGNQPEIGEYEAQVTIYRMADNEIAHIGSARFRDVDQGEIPVPGLAAGQYTAHGYVNSGGVDPGSPPNEEGYRTPFSFSLQVGGYAQDASGISATGMDQLYDHVDSLAVQLDTTEDPNDFADLVNAVCGDLAALEALAPKASALANARGEANAGRTRLERVQRVAVLDAAAALRNLTPQLRNLQFREDDDAIRGLVFAFVDEFVARVEDAVTPEHDLGQ